MLELERREASTPEPESYNVSFGDHIASVYPKFPFTRHTTRLVEVGQRVFDGEIQRTLLMLPPRHFKSTIFSRFGPSYFLRKHPDRTWAQGAHTQPLAAEFGKAARDYFVASGGALDASSTGKLRWTIANTLGGFWGAGVGGGTGLPAHFISIDDPIKNREEAESAAYRRRMQDWILNVMFAREEPGCGKLITHTRWADADLIGWLLSQVEELERDGNADAAEPWHVIEMPLIAEPIQTQIPATLTRERDDRKPGEALDPTRYDKEWARKKRLNLPERDWLALYQQRPKPEGGTVFSAQTFRFWTPAGVPGEEGDVLLPARFIRLFLSVDCSFKDNPGTDMVAMGLWGQTDAGLFKLDMINQRMGFSDTLGTIKAMQPSWGFGELVIEDKANGSAVIDSLKQARAGFSVHAVNPEGGKVARANASTPQFNQGRVFFPRHHKLTPVLTSQLLKFPGDTYDDLVDEVTQAINFAQGTGPMRITTAHYGRGTAAPPVSPDSPPARVRPRSQAGFR
jgi:predicted phage terminase large subunit-like protein